MIATESMRKIDTRRARLAPRGTGRVINQQIVLNMIRERQPISRADLARRMQVGRGTITHLVDALIAEGAVYEGAVLRTARGRRPIMLHVRTASRTVMAVDVRFSRTSIMLSDLGGQQIALESFQTPAAPAALIEQLGFRIQRLQARHGAGDNCDGIGMVVPGIVDRRTGVVLNSPQLGWRNVAVRQTLAAATSLPVFVENDAIALALGYMWLHPSGRDGRDAVDNFIYVSVSEGIGAGVVLNGEIMRGHGDTPGDFGHVPLNPDGPQCICGLRGCWEAYTSDVATLARYFGLDAALPESREQLRDKGFTLPDLVARAQSGDMAARAALRETGRYLGAGLSVMISALNPGRIVIGGAIMAAWPLIQDIVRTTARERALVDAAAAIPIIPAPLVDSPRLRGATALLVARNFAAPKVA